MKLRTTTAVLLILAASACGRSPAVNNVASPPPAPQTNAVVAPPLAPPSTGNVMDPAPADQEAEVSAAKGCAGEIGERAAEQLVLQCRDVSQATRPPCNVANSCAMIREEIERGCVMLGADSPEFCPPAG